MTTLIRDIAGGGFCRAADTVSAPVSLVRLSPALPTIFDMAFGGFFAPVAAAIGPSGGTVIALIPAIKYATLTVPLQALSSFVTFIIQPTADIYANAPVAITSSGGPAVKIKSPIVSLTIPVTVGVPVDKTLIGSVDPMNLLVIAVEDNGQAVALKPKSFDAVLSILYVDTTVLSSFQVVVPVLGSSSASSVGGGGGGGGGGAGFIGYTKFPDFRHPRPSALPRRQPQERRPLPRRQIGTVADKAPAPERKKHYEPRRIVYVDRPIMIEVEKPVGLAKAVGVTKVVEVKEYVDRPVIITKHNTEYIDRPVIEERFVYVTHSPLAMLLCAGLAAGVFFAGTYVGKKLLRYYI